MQHYCVDCARGDRNAAVVANDTINDPAIDQFLDGRSPFGEPASDGRDPTGSGSGT